MANALQERAVERVTAAVPTGTIVVDPDRPSTATLSLFQVWDRAGRHRASFAVDGRGDFAGGTVRLFGASSQSMESYSDLTAFVAAVLMGGGW